MDETPRALRAFEDYYNSGATRSLRKLAEFYRARSAEGEEVPTRHFETLAQWSRAHNWQDRVKKRTQEDAARVRAVMQGGRSVCGNAVSLKSTSTVTSSGCVHPMRYGDRCSVTGTGAAVLRAC